MRGIDCPELDTPEGKAAKAFVETLVKDAQSVTVTTTKPDKWDRYLCDVFLIPSPLWGEGGRRPDEVRDEGALKEHDEPKELFRNNLLLENGHARRYDKVALEDWEE